MSELEGFSYAVFAVYALTSAGLALAGRKLGVASTSTWPLMAFVAAGMWPLLRLAVGDLIAQDPLQERLDGLTGDLVGHALLAVGALIAMMAEVQILTRGRVAAASAGEPPAGPVVYRCVAGGRVVQLAGLFLVFPSVILAGPTVIAAAAILATPRTNQDQKSC
jgi:hypothetical protein